jgi:hypothetical protein
VILLWLCISAIYIYLNAGYLCFDSALMDQIFRSLQSGFGGYWMMVSLGRG